MTKTFYIFSRAIGIIVISFKGEDIGNMFPICISECFLYMCSEPFVMVLNVRTSFRPDQWTVDRAVSFSQSRKLITISSKYRRRIQNQFENKRSH